jgi:hypothetical protein
MNPAFSTSEQQHRSSAACNINMQQQQQQQRPKPLIQFSNNDTTLMQRDIMNHDDAVDSYFSDAADNEPILSRSTLRQPITRLSSPITIDTVNNVRKSSPPPPVCSSLNNNIKLSPTIPPASTILTATTSPNSRNLMDRMKERHRQEVRRSLNGSQFL